MPPSTLRVRVQTPDRRIGIWVPLIFFWPPLVVLGLLLSPVIAAGALLLWRRGWGKSLLMAGPRLFGLFAALKGLQIRVDDPPELVLISFK